MTNMKLYRSIAAVFIGLIAVAGLITTTTVSAQVVGSCVSLSQNLSYGQRDAYAGNDIYRLQQFLVSQGLLTVAPTGYFGTATRAAVQSFQSRNSLPVTGSVDLVTRAIIAIRSCSGQGSYNPNPYNPTYPTSAPVLTGVSLSNVAVGNTVTIYGNGFDYGYNRVNIGNQQVSGNSSNGTSVTFVVPQLDYYNNYNGGYGYGYNNGQICAQIYPYQCYNNYNYPQTYSVTVTTARGTSNPLNITVTGNNGGYYPAQQTPTISNVGGPTSVSAGTNSTWSFVVSNVPGNYASASVIWGDENMYTPYNSYGNQVSNQNVYQGSQTVTFTHTYQTPGTYNIVFTVSGSWGQPVTSTLTVNVTNNSNYYPYNNNCYYYGAYNCGNNYYGVSISGLSSTSGRPGNQIVITGNGFTNSNTVRFGNGLIQNVAATNSTSLTFTIPYILNYCEGYSSSYCTGGQAGVTAGYYPISVMNVNGQSNTINFTVTQY